MKLHAIFLTAPTLVLVSCMFIMCKAVFTPTAIPGSLNAAKTIAVSSSGRYLVIAETNAQYIRVLDMNNPSAWLASAGIGSQGYLDHTSPTSSAFNNPFGAAILENNNEPQAIYVADSGNNCIRKITWSTWTVIVVSAVCTISGKADGVQLVARYNSPRGIATVGNDTAYIADTGNSVIRKLVISTATVTTLTTSFSSLPGPPIYIDGFTDSASSTVLWVSVGTTSGTFSGLVKITLSGSSETAVAVFSSYGGGGVAVSPPDSRGVSWVYVASSTLVGSLRTVNASNSAIYANSSNVATTVVLGMAINGTTSGASVLAIVNSGSQVGVLSGISTAPTGDRDASGCTNTTSASITSSLSSSQLSSSRTRSSSKVLTGTRTWSDSYLTVSATPITLHTAYFDTTSNTDSATPTAHATSGSVQSSGATSVHSGTTLSQSISRRALNSTTILMPSSSLSSPTSLLGSRSALIRSASQSLMKMRVSHDVSMSTRPNLASHTRAGPTHLTLSASPSILFFSHERSRPCVLSKLRLTDLVFASNNKSIDMVMLVEASVLSSTDKITSIYVNSVAQPRLLSNPVLALNITLISMILLNASLNIQGHAQQLLLNWTAHYGTNADTALSSWATIVLEPPLEGGWVDTTTSSFIDTTLAISLGFMCSQSFAQVNIVIPVQGTQLQLTQAVKSAGGYSQLVSGLVGGTSSGTALGRVMATRNIVLCDAGAAVIGGAIDLGIVICVGDEGSIIAARSNVISNVVVVATVASFLLSLAVLWKFLHRRNDTFTNAVLMFRLPSSLLPILTAVLPSTASSTTYLLTNLINSRCIATDIVLSLCGFVLSVGPPAIVILFWQTFCRGAHSSLSCVNERKLQVEKGHTNGAIRRFIGAPLAALSARTHKWRCAASHHRHNPVEETSLPLRMGWTILLEYRQLWFASLDLVIIFLAACFGVASGLEGVEQCRAFSLVVVAMFTVELVILCIARPFTTVLSAVHTATCLFLTVLSATAQLIFVFLSSSSGAASALWLADASAVFDLIIIGVSAVKTLVDAREALLAALRRWSWLRLSSSNNDEVDDTHTLFPGDEIFDIGVDEEAMELDDAVMLMSGEGDEMSSSPGCDDELFWNSDGAAFGTELVEGPSDIMLAEALQELPMEEEAYDRLSDADASEIVSFH